jgi:hypothetical protein
VRVQENLNNTVGLSTGERRGLFLRGRKIEENSFNPYYSSVVLVFLIANFPAVFPSILKMPILGQVACGILLAIFPLLATSLVLVLLLQRYGIKRAEVKLRDTQSQER